MAIMAGTSGAWNDIAEELAQKNIRVQGISELEQVLFQYKEMHAEEKNKYESGKRDLDEKFVVARENLSSKHSLMLRDINAKYARQLQSIDKMLQGQKNALPQRKILFSWLFSLPSRINIYLETKKLLRKRKNVEKKKKLTLLEAEKKFADKTRNIEKKRHEYEIMLAAKKNTLEARISLLEEVLSSNVYYGALAELEMIQFLGKLPDTHYVFNDVSLEFSRSILFDGKWLKSAQIDHLVLAPSGIFTIEVKNWSQKFVNDGDYFDPFSQVKRANYVCYTRLGKEFGATVHSIIASAGYLPERPASSRAKVLSLADVNGYILWFKEQKHDKTTLEQMAKQLGLKTIT